MCDRKKQNKAKQNFLPHTLRILINCSSFFIYVAIMECIIQFWLGCAFQVFLGSLWGCICDSWSTKLVDKCKNPRMPSCFFPVMIEIPRANLGTQKLHGPHTVIPRKSSVVENSLTCVKHMPGMHSNLL